MNKKDEIMELLKQDKLEAVLSELLILSKDNDFQKNDLIILQARLTDVSKQIHLNTISKDAEQIEKNKIRVALVNYISRVESPSNEFKNEEGKDKFTKFKQNAILKGLYFHNSPWEEAMTEEEYEFKKLLRFAPNKSTELLKMGRYPEIIELWKQLEENQYFDINHEYWEDKPFFRIRIQVGLTDLFVSNVVLGWQKGKEYNIVALKYLQKILQIVPYDQSNSYGSLAPKEAQRFNLDLVDVLEYSLETFIGVSCVPEMVDKTEYEIALIEDRVKQKIGQVKIMMK